MVLWGSESIMKMYISSRDLFEMLSKYYSSRLQKMILIGAKVENARNIRTIKSAKVSLYYEEQIRLLGQLVIKRTVIKDSELKAILKEWLDKDDYQLVSFEYDTYIGQVDYYRDSVDEILFGGLTIHLKEKKKQKVLRRWI